MPNLDERIAQWENMTREAPDDMSWFSLGSAYKDAGRLEDADKAFAKAMALNPGMSRACQLRGQILIELGRNDEAADLLTTGYQTAAERGDVMPQKAMEELLKKIGRPPVPEVARIKGPAVTSPDQILDRRTGRAGSRLPDSPMRGPVGQYIYDHFSMETWQEWIAMGTKVINELRLDFSNRQHQDTYDQHMMEWLEISQEDVDQHAKARADSEKN